MIERFDWVLYVFGAFLLYTAGKLVFTDNDHVDPSESKFLKLVNKFVKTTHELDGQKLFTKENGKRLATPLFSVLLLVEATDVIFAVDSRAGGARRQPRAVHRVRVERVRDPRPARPVLPARRHAQPVRVTCRRASAIILAFVGVKMLIHTWYHIPTWLSLLVIAIVLIASIGFSLKVERSQRDAQLASGAVARRHPEHAQHAEHAEHVEVPPPPDER